VDHSPVLPALGYRVDFAGKSVAIRGDTIDTEGLQDMSQGADVLVSEVMNKSFLQDAGVGTLVLARQVPTLDDDVQIGFAFRTPIATIFGGELIVGVDGTSVTGPVP